MVQRVERGVVLGFHVVVELEVYVVVVVDHVVGFEHGVDGVILDAVVEGERVRCVFGDEEACVDHCVLCVSVVEVDVQL